MNKDIPNTESNMVHIDIEELVSSLDVSNVSLRVVTSSSVVVSSSAVVVTSSWACIYPDIGLLKRNTVIKNIPNIFFILVNISITDRIYHDISGY